MKHMKKKICPLLEKFCPLFKRFAHCTICPLSSAGQKRGCFGVGFGVFCVGTMVHILERDVWRLSEEQRLGAVFWAKWDPTWAKRGPSGQFAGKVGKSALELGEKNWSYKTLWPELACPWGGHHSKSLNIDNLTKNVRFAGLSFPFH